MADQPYDSDLAALAALTGTGLAARTGADAWALRTLVGADLIAIGNGDGVAGDPQLSTRFQRPEAGAAARTGLAKLGDVIDPADFGADGVGDDTAGWASLIAAAPAGAAIDLGGRTYGVSQLTVSKTLHLSNGGFNFSAMPSGQGCVEIAASARPTFTNIAFKGTGGQGAYVGAHVLLRQQGASSASRAAGFVLDRCRLEGSGAYGVYAKWSDRILILDTDVADCAYVGVGLWSCNDAQVRGGRIEMLNAAGTSGNAYGLALSHDSTGYASDPNAGTPRAANPFCRNVLVHGLTVIGPKLWQAIDTHGAYGVKVIGCHVYGAARGVSLTTGSGAAETYAGYDNIAVGNVIDANLPDGTAVSGLNPVSGFELRGGFPGGTSHERFVVMGNTIRGYGQVDSAEAGSIRATVATRKYVIANNVIENWAGVGINLGAGQLGGVVTGNVFGDLRVPMAADGGTETYGYCISISSAAAGAMVVSGNIHDYVQNRAHKGFNVHPNATITCSVGDNHFSRCLAATPIDVPRGRAHGVGAPSVIDIPQTSGTITVDVSLSRLAPGAPLIVRAPALTDNLTITDFTGAPLGTRIVVMNDSAHTVTVTRANALLRDGLNWTGDTRYSQLELVKGVPYWREASRSKNG
ncbi:right-handed parallel beta-helix repeat-containing protein [Caulobacter mirabilis]|uniref:Right handed beta helix domain-containing protein n=1 Tax=Caulobacter mirabilis TaxID=69666 RepID=A0A2D2AXS7_9CAUL|nr:right-handed parallel beta-helix repeat-containing protein [Caulobacter mirabilis]ATQ42816.1 hypothetical protein CSW64_10555 [Caulobacter mirabilis]